MKRSIQQFRLVKVMAGSRGISHKSGLSLSACSKALFTTGVLAMVLCSVLGLIVSLFS